MCFDLKYAVEHGIIDVPAVRSMIEMEKRKELLAEHPFKPWEGKNGFWYVYIPDEKKGRVLKKRKTQSDIENVIVEYQRTLRDNPTIDDIFTDWNDHRLALRKITKSSHTRFKEIYKRHFTEFGKLRIKDISEDQIIDFLEGQIPEHNLSAKGFASLKTVMRGILKRAKRKKYISFSPEMLFADLDVSDRDFSKTIKEDCDQVFDETETELMVNYLTQNCDIRNAGILLIFVSGLRIGELVALTREDLDPEFCVVRVRKTETRYKEDGETFYEVADYPKTAAGVRDIVVPSSYRWLLRQLYIATPAGEFIFSEKGKRLTTLQIRKREYSVCKKLCIRKKSPHKIRATYDTILLDASVDRRMVKDQMGHADIRTSESNYHRNRKSHDRKQEIMDSIKEFQGA